MTTARPSAATHATRTPLVRRYLTREPADAFELVNWSKRSVQLTEPDGRVAFATGVVEAPISWSNLAVAVVARRYFARAPGAAPERSVRTLVERVVQAIASWAQDAGHVHGAAERRVLRDEVAALVLTQRATFATPVWLNAGLAERPLTSACFILKAGDSIPQLLDWNTREGLIFQQGGGAGINLADPLLTRAGLTRRAGQRAGVVHARHRRVGGNDPRRRPCPPRREDGRARRVSPRTSSSSSRPRHARRTAAGRCWRPDIRSTKWSPRSPSSTPTIRCG